MRAYQTASLDKENVCAIGYGTCERKFFDHD